MKTARISGPAASGGFCTYQGRSHESHCGACLPDGCGISRRSATKFDLPGDGYNDSLPAWDIWVSNGPIFLSAEVCRNGAG